MFYREFYQDTGEPTPEARAAKAREALDPWIEASGEDDDTYIVDFVADLMHALGGPEGLEAYVDRASIHYFAERVR